MALLVGDVRTDRLILRRWRESDLGALAAVFAKPDVWWFPFERGLTLEETRSFLERMLDEWNRRGWSLWAAVHRQDDRLIGFLGLSPPEFLPEVMPTVEVGWRLDPDYWGQGLATEGGCAALRVAFDVLDLPEVVSICDRRNTASERVMVKLGMTFDRETDHPQMGNRIRVYRITRSSVPPRGPGRAG
jgi:RimJ/RimL family protein N-acetyltransferase